MIDLNKEKQMIHGMPTGVRVWTIATAALARAGILSMCLFLAGFAHAHDEDIAPLVDRLKQSVVNIELYGIVDSNRSYSGILPKDSPLWDLLNRNNPESEDNTVQPTDVRIKIGSGFITSEDGYIVTNNHVVEDGNRIIVEMQNGERLPAEVVGTDVSTDIAVLKIESDEALIAVPFGNSESAREGDTVIAIGNPFGLGFSVSKGIISARYRRMGGIDDEFIQTDAAINVGNSGGPLFNLKGEVIGVNTAIIPGNGGRGGGGSIGIAFSMSSAVVENVVNSIIEHGTVLRGWLGIVMQGISEDFAEALGLDSAKGVLVTAVSKGSPAEKAGLQRGDVILFVGDEEINDIKHMQKVIMAAGPGAEVIIEIIRKGKIIHRTAELELRNDEAISRVVTTPGDEREIGTILGLDVTPLNDQMRQQYQLDDNSTGLVVTGVDQDSEAFTMLIRPGDLIVEINEVEVDSITSAEEAIARAKSDGKSRVLLLMVTRGRTVAVSLGIE